MSKNKTFKILVVDDNRDIVSSTKNLLQKLGHQVTVAYDGQEAVEAVKREKPDIIFLDIGMPRLNGYEAAIEIKNIESTSGIMLVAITGYGQPGDIRRSKNSGIHYHYTKPVSLTDFNEIFYNFNRFRNRSMSGA